MTTGGERKNGFGAGADEREEAGGDGVGGACRGRSGRIKREASAEGLPLLDVREEARVRREVSPRGSEGGARRGGERHEDAEGEGDEAEEPAVEGKTNHDRRP